MESIENLSSIESEKAWKDLEVLGYDVNALRKMNLGDDRLIELRDKAYRFRGMKIPRSQ